MVNKIKIVGIGTISVIILVTASVAAWQYTHKNSESKNHNGKAAIKKVNSVDYSPPTDAQRQAGEETSEHSKMETSNPPPSTTSPQNGTIIISRVNQPANDSIISLRTKVEGLTDGICVATFTKDGQAPVDQKSSLTSSATYYSCAPIDIAVSRFGANGTWKVSVLVTNQQGVKASNIATGTVEVTK